VRAFVAAAALASMLAAARARADDVPPIPTATDAAAPPVEEVQVRAAPRAKEATSFGLARAESGLVPGTQGDSLKVVQSLPGVARPAFGTGQLVVWGSAPEDTRVYVDGVEIPALYHGGGLRSTVNAELVRSIDFVPGGWGAEYGRGLGGLVRAETRALPTEGTHGYLSADTLDGSGMVSTTIGDRVRVGAAARYGWVDRVLDVAGAPDLGDYYAIPRYGDAQALASVALREGESITLVALGSEDDLRRAIPSADPARVRAQTTDASFGRVYAHYARTLEDGAVVHVTPFVGTDRSALDATFGAEPARLDESAWRYGVRASHQASIIRTVVLTSGVDVMGTRTSLSRAGSLTIPPREGDVTAFGQPPGDDVAGDTWWTHVLDVAPYAVAQIDAGPLTITPGARLDAFLVEGSRSTPRVGQTPAVGFSRLTSVVDPRVSLRWRATRRLSLLASGGTYHQPPAPEDLSAVFGTPALTLSHATHATFGESLAVTETLSVEATAFYKSLGDLPVRSRLPAPILARALVQDGEGRAYGLQILVRQQLARGFFGWLSYTLSRSERRYVGDAQWRLFDYDQPHVLAIVASKTIGTWTVGARFRWMSGLPRTPVAGAIYDARDDVYQPLFGAQNSTRLPDFEELDLRVDKSLGPHLRAYVEIDNATLHANKEEIVYSDDYTRKGYVTGLPAMGVVGARGEW
jgi:hypothetical protein